MRLFKLNKLLKVWAHLTGLWFKKTYVSQLSYESDALRKEAEKNWAILYDVRDEQSWRIVMRQLDIAYNQELLNLSKLELSDKGLVRLAVHKGVMNFIHSFRVALDEQFRLLKDKNKQGEEATHARKIVGKPSRRTVRPPMS